MDPVTLFTKQGSVLYTDAACQVSGVNPELNCTGVTIVAFGTKDFMPSISMSGQDLSVQCSGKWRAQREGAWKCD
jgi:hypothetical protein